MGLMDKLKARHEGKALTLEINQMYKNWNNLIEVYNNDLIYGNCEYRDEECYSVWRNMCVNVGGQTQSIGVSKTTTYTDPQAVPNYEFLLLYTSAESQSDNRYYTMTATGNFTSDRGLASFMFKYLANVDGRDIPCTATINMNTGDLLNLRKESIVPVVTPAVKSVSPDRCAPDLNDICFMISEFSRVNNLGVAIHHTETTSDFMPGV